MPTPSAFLVPAALALAAINLMTVLAFAHDKARAASGGWRVRESTLLALALFGGSILYLIADFTVEIYSRIPDLLL